MFDNNELTDNLTPEQETALSAEVERLVQLAGQYGLNVNDDETAHELLKEFADRIDYSNRMDRGNADEALEAVQKVAGRRQGQAKLDEIRSKFKREPTISENLHAGYQQARPIEGPVQPPPKDASPIKLLEYYYKNLSTSAEKKE